MDLLYNLSISNYYHFMPAKAPSTKWDSSEPTKYGAVEVEVFDMYRDALGFVEYRDRAGNVTVDTLIYIADQLNFYVDSLNIDYIEFSPNKIVDSTYTTKIKIKNVSKKEIHIQELFILEKESMFTLSKGAEELPLTLGPDEEHEIEITYKPTKDDYTSFDKLIVYTDCLEFIISMVGSTKKPKIEVNDIDFGDILVGTKTTRNENNSVVSLMITNNGTADLHITGYHFDPPQDSINGPFFYEPYPISDTVSLETPWRIRPGSQKTVRYIYFLPSEQKTYETKLYFISNAVDSIIDPNRKDYAVIKGTGIQDNTHIEYGIGGNTYSLLPISPNPFNGTELTINYSLGQSGDVNINIYNTAGELVKEVVNNSETAGEYSKTVNISDLVSGTYIITMKSRAYETQQQLMIVK
ncbi:MAG: T9SS type A sorting domain-containing protein [Bacteroidetes bacterium]|nr:T9SS type A sorting domain-containing protein [Bacteroidota bacterium]